MYMDNKVEQSVKLQGKGGKTVHPKTRNLGYKFNRSAYIPKIQKILSDATELSHNISQQLHGAFSYSSKIYAGKNRQENSFINPKMNKLQRPHTSVNYRNKESRQLQSRAQSLVRSLHRKNTQPQRKSKQLPMTENSTQLSMHLSGTLKKINKFDDIQDDPTQSTSKYMINLNFENQQEKQIMKGYKNPEDIVYDCFCSKYRKYTKLKKPSQDSKALKKFHEKQNKILQTMINQGLMEQNQFRLISKFYDTYLMMKQNPIIKRNKQQYAYAHPNLKKKPLFD